MSAEDEMWEGYQDGRKADNPEPSANRSRSYRHGFAAGRADLNRSLPCSFDEMRRRAEEAIEADAADAAMMGVER